MAVTEGLLKFTLTSLHAALWLRNWISVSFKGLWMCILQFAITKYKGKKLEDISSDAKKLEKIPQHLAVLIHQEFVSCDDLAHVAVWAFACGIRTVSFYDSNGKILELRSVLQSKISHHHQQLFSPSLPDFRVYTSKELSNLPSSRTQICQETGMYQVVLLSPEDGRQKLVQVATDVCKAVVSRKERLDLVSVDTLAPRIAGAVGLSDPELVLVCGQTCSVMGYPPWHLRLSEIHTLTSHHKVKYKDFYSVLQKFSSCKQRLGK